MSKKKPKPDKVKKTRVVSVEVGTPPALTTPTNSKLIFQTPSEAP